MYIEYLREWILKKTASRVMGEIIFLNRKGQFAHILIPLTKGDLTSNLHAMKIRSAIRSACF